MKTRREFLNLLGKVVVVSGMVAVAPCASLFGAPVPTVDDGSHGELLEGHVTISYGDYEDYEPARPQHEHIVTGETVSSHTHMLHEWEMPSHR